MNPLIPLSGLVIIVLFLSKFKPKKNNSPIVKKNMYTEQDAKDAILNIEKKYGKEMAQTVEKMARLETNHFKSSQFKLTGTAGMEAGAWGKYLPDVKQTIMLKDPVLGMRPFLVWNPMEFFIFLAEYIKRYNGNYGRWNSTNPDKQKKYIATVNTVKSRFV